MELLHALLLVALPALCCFNVSAALYYQDTFIRGRDKVTAHDIYLECCDQKWTQCCKKYKPNNSSGDAATPPPIPRSLKNPKCTQAKSRREQSQALQAVTMLDILTDIHRQYRTVRRLEECVLSVNITRRSELLRKISLLKSALEYNTLYCCVSHWKNNHTVQMNEITKKASHILEEIHKKIEVTKYTDCVIHGNTVAIVRQFSTALHRLGQQLKGLECLEALSVQKSKFCRDICIRKKSVEKCISIWL